MDLCLHLCQSLCVVLSFSPRIGNRPDLETRGPSVFKSESQQGCHQWPLGLDGDKSPFELEGDGIIKTCRSGEDADVVWLDDLCSPGNGDSIVIFLNEQTQTSANWKLEMQ